VYVNLIIMELTVKKVNFFKYIILHKILDVSALTFEICLTKNCIIVSEIFSLLIKSISLRIYCFISIL
jgi:hypothetical protein